MKPIAKDPQKVVSQGPPVRVSAVLRCGIFTFVSVNGVFAGSVIWNYENWRSLRKKPSTFRKWFNATFARIFGRYPQQSDIFWAIAFTNMLVFLANNGRRGPKLLRYTTNSPYGPWPATSMVISMFSHQMFLHMFLNLYVLHNFTKPVVGMLGMEQYLAIYLGGGIFSSFLSLFSKAARRSMVPSIGTSGAVCAILGTFCMLQPSAQLCIPGLVHIFPHSFTAESTAWFILFFEFFAAMTLTSRSPIDHAAHLGGLMFGMYYGMQGKELMLERRKMLVEAWQKLRG